MARKRTGLRNRFRNGRGTYSRKGKSAASDRYGKFTGGHRDTPDRIRTDVRTVDTTTTEAE